MEHYSVLMSVYYKEKPDYLRQAMESIWQQTIQTDDFVLVCDGPLTAGLDTVIEEMQEAHSKTLHVIRLDKNCGLGKALNIGLKECKNEFVARMDSDDFSLPDRFNKQISYLEIHPEIDVLGGQIAEYDANMENELDVRAVPVSADDIAVNMKIRNQMNHVTVIYKKTSVISAGSYQDCPFFEDYYLWCRMSKAGYTFHNLDSVLVNVRTGEDMYQRRGGKVYNEAIIGFQKKILKLGVINRFQYLCNIAVRLSVANMPNTLRSYIYKTRLRTKSVEK